MSGPQAVFNETGPADWARHFLLSEKALSRSFPLTPVEFGSLMWPHLLKLDQRVFHEN